MHVCCVWVSTSLGGQMDARFLCAAWELGKGPRAGALMWRYEGRRERGTRAAAMQAVAVPFTPPP